MRASERPCGSQPINTSSPLSSWPIRSPASSIYGLVGCARTHFPCRLHASRFTCWFGVSLIPLSLAFLYTYVLVTVNTQSLSNLRLTFLSMGTAYTRDDKRILPVYSVVIRYRSLTFTRECCHITRKYNIARKIRRQSAGGYVKQLMIILTVSANIQWNKIHVGFIKWNIFGCMQLRSPKVGCQHNICSQNTCQNKRKRRQVTWQTLFFCLLID